MCKRPGTRSLNSGGCRAPDDKDTMTDQTAAILYVACLTLATFLGITILVTGAFFSRTMGVPLSTFGVLLSVSLLITPLLSPSGAWWMLLPGVILLLGFVFLLIASLGGERG